MKRRLLLLCFAAALSGCATFEKSELATVRARGVSTPVVEKLDRGRPVVPADVIELTRRGIADEWIIRQIDDHGVDSLISRRDVLAMRKAGVRPTVMDALLKASDRFRAEYQGPDYRYAGWGYDYPSLYDPWYDPWPGGYYGGYGGFGATFVVPLHSHHGHHHHRH